MKKSTLKLTGKTIIVTGASRGIGREMAIRFAKDSANIVIIGKTVEPHPTLSGTIYSVAKEVKNLGGTALPIPLDLRNNDEFDAVVKTVMDAFGRIDALINNASALNLSNFSNISAKQYDLIQSVNSRGTFLFTQACIPHLIHQKISDVITISPPINLNTQEFSRCPAYTMSKYAMSMSTIAISKSYRKFGLRANSLWPKTTLATAAIETFLPYHVYVSSRHPRIMADAAYAILTHPDKSLTGNFFLDDDILINCGITNLVQYKRNRLIPTIPDLFLS
jgi:citronellol/citronellal dehydrogenase